MLILFSNCFSIQFHIFGILVFYWMYFSEKSWIMNNNRDTASEISKNMKIIPNYCLIFRRCYWWPKLLEKFMDVLSVCRWTLGRGADLYHSRNIMKCSRFIPNVSLIFWHYFNEHANILLQYYKLNASGLIIHVYHDIGRIYCSKIFVIHITTCIHV